MFTLNWQESISGPALTVSGRDLDLRRRRLLYKQKNAVTLQNPFYRAID
jgi:hypothetical protein